MTDFDYADDRRIEQMVTLGSLHAGCIDHDATPAGMLDCAWAQAVAEAKLIDAHQFAYRYGHARAVRVAFDGGVFVLTDDGSWQKVGDVDMYERREAENDARTLVTAWLDTRTARPVINAPHCEREASGYLGCNLSLRIFASGAVWLECAGGREWQQVGVIDLDLSDRDGAVTDARALACDHTPANA